MITSLYGNICKFVPRIVHVIVRKSEIPKSSHASWEGGKEGKADENIKAEEYQRDQIVRGVEWLRSAKGNKMSIDEEDIVMISDVDEIPSASTARQLILETGDFTGSRRQQCLRFPVFLNLRWFIYSFNWRSTKQWGMVGGEGVRAVLVRQLTAEDSDAVGRARPSAHRRNLRTHAVHTLLNGGASGASEGVSVIDDAGWHISYFGGPKAVSEKLRAFYAADMYRDEYWHDEERIKRFMRNGKPLFQGRSFNFSFVPTSESTSKKAALGLPTLVQQSYEDALWATGDGLNEQQNRFAGHFSPAIRHLEEVGDLAMLEQDILGAKYLKLEQDGFYDEVLMPDGSGGGDSGANAETTKMVIADCDLASEPRHSVTIFCREYAVTPGACDKLAELAESRCRSALEQQQWRISIDVNLDRSLLVPYWINGLQYVAEIATGESSAVVARRICDQKRLGAADCAQLGDYFKQQRQSRS
jgi:hypothetical protein